jgi:peptidoglycan/LPS O-acetylase OafA/YrhL
MKFPDGLRAVAAMMVILPHSAGLFAYWAPSILIRATLAICQFGRFGVQIFFVLSGFVIAYTLRAQKFTPASVGRFLVRRSIRLDPPYWAAIAIFWIYMILQNSFGHHHLSLPRAAQLVAHLFYMQDLLGYGDINVVFWTLCIEIQFYLVFCLLLWILQPTGFWHPWIFLAIFVGSLVYPIGLANSVRDGALFLPYWYAFLVGAIVWWMIDDRLPHFVAFASVAVLLGIGLAKFEPTSIVTAVTAGSILAAHHFGGLYRWLDTRPIQFLGKISYCIYLVHVPVVGVLLAAQERLAPNAVATSYFLLFSGLAMSIGAAYVLHISVEAPALRWSKAIKEWCPGRTAEAALPVTSTRMGDSVSRRRDSVTVDGK